MSIRSTCFSMDRRTTGTTKSPGANPVTLPPTAITSPKHSCPRINWDSPSGTQGSAESKMSRSVPQTPNWIVRHKTCVSRGEAGSETSIKVGFLEPVCAAIACIKTNVTICGRMAHLYIFCAYLELTASVPARCIQYKPSTIESACLAANRCWDATL